MLLLLKVYINSVSTCDPRYHSICIRHFMIIYKYVVLISVIVPCCSQERKAHATTRFLDLQSLVGISINI